MSALPISGDCTFTALPIVGKSTVSIYPTDFRWCICKRHSYLHRKWVSFFYLTALDLLNWITQWRHNIKILKISAVDFETMLCLCISIKKFQISWNCLFKLDFSRQLFFTRILLAIMINKIKERNAPIVKLKVVSPLTLKQTARTCLNVKACMYSGGTFINHLTYWHGIQTFVAWPRKSLQTKGEHVQLFLYPQSQYGNLKEAHVLHAGMLFRNCTSAIANSDVRFFKSVTWRLYFWDF
jgi:hypothetical protein